MKGHGATMAEATTEQLDKWRVADVTDALGYSKGRGRAVCESLALFGLIRPTADAQAEVDHLNARERLADVAESMLRELRWAEWVAEAGVHDSAQAFCPWCSSRRLEGHKSDCPLAAVLARADGRQPG